MLNAVVEERYEDAIKRAKEIDIMLENEKLSVENLEKSMPLLGVPFTTKESNEAKGKKNATNKTVISIIYCILNSRIAPFYGYIKPKRS